MCLPWQHWTKASVWFDDADISAFHSCVVFDLWQSLSEWHLLLCACVLVCRRQNVGAWIRAVKFLATKLITVLEHTAFSPDIAPSDFYFLFPKIKEILKWRHFDDIRSNTTAAIEAIPQNQFQNCFEGWIRRWHRCIASQRGVLWRRPQRYSAVRYVAFLLQWVRELYCQITYCMRVMGICNFYRTCDNLDSLVCVVVKWLVDWLIDWLIDCKIAYKGA